MSDVTSALRADTKGTSKAEELLPVVYDELRRLAAAQLAHEQPGQTLQPTALVHEAWLKLASSRQQWLDRHHFFGAAAQAMRRILTDRARKRHRVRHGGGLARCDLESVELAITTKDEVLLCLDEALIQLAIEDPLKAKLVELRYFAGLTIPEAARALNLSPATAKRHWAYTRAWLYCALSGTWPELPH